MKIKSNKLVATLNKSRRSKSLEAIVKIHRESIGIEDAKNGRDKGYPYWWTGRLKGEI